MASLEIDRAFPAGNGIVERIDGDQVTLHQELRDTEGFWFYWYFRVRGAAGRKLTFTFADSSPVGVRGPAVSQDEGLTWRWATNQPLAQNAFTHTFAGGDHSVRFSFGMPYTAANWHRFLDRLGHHPSATPAVLCTSRKGRPVELLRLAPDRDDNRWLVVVTCRHHCCEMMANYALEGLIEAGLDDGPDGRLFRDRAALLAVPFVDKDGVEDGDQGKNRRPRDHGRDYQGQPLYPETAAIQKLLAADAGRRRLIGLDLHCPWIRGEWNEQIYQVGAQDAAVWAGQRWFGDLLEQVRTGPLPYAASHDLPFGVAWNTVSNFAQGRGFKPWFATLPGAALVTTFEIPYANASGSEVNADSARAFGRDLAHALARYCAAEDGQPRP